jgi:hypothetical protein
MEPIEEYVNLKTQAIFIHKLNRLTYLQEHCLTLYQSSSLLLGIPSSLCCGRILSSAIVSLPSIGNVRSRPADIGGLFMPIGISYAYRNLHGYAHRNLHAYMNLLCL